MLPNRKICVNLYWYFKKFLIPLLVILLLGLDNLADDPLYATNAARVENRHKLLPLLKEW